MKSLFNYGVMLFASMGLVLLNSCGTDPEPPDATLPEPDGTVTINFLNYPGANPSVNATGGDIIAVAVEMVKGTGSRPQKLRVFETTVMNTRGTQVGTTIDLRNQDKQTKNVNYTVPSTNGIIYLYFEVDESGGKFSRKILTINVGGVGGINTWTGVKLGASGNSLPATMSSATGQTYTVAGADSSDAAANIADIDITYIETLAATGPWFASYPARSKAPFNISSATIKGASATYFTSSTLTAAEFDAIADLTALNTAIGTAPAATDPEYYPPVTGSVAVGSVIEFKNGRGKAGLIKITGYEPGSSGTVTIDVKVQR